MLKLWSAEWVVMFFFILVQNSLGDPKQLDENTRKALWVASAIKEVASNQVALKTFDVFNAYCEYSTKIEQEKLRKILFEEKKKYTERFKLLNPNLTEVSRYVQSTEHGLNDFLLIRDASNLRDRQAKILESVYDNVRKSGMTSLIEGLFPDLKIKFNRTYDRAFISSLFPSLKGVPEFQDFTRKVLSGSLDKSDSNVIRAMAGSNFTRIVNLTEKSHGIIKTALDGIPTGSLSMVDSIRKQLSSEAGALALVGSLAESILPDQVKKIQTFGQTGIKISETLMDYLGSPDQLGTLFLSTNMVSGAVQVLNLFSGGIGGNSAIQKDLVEIKQKIDAVMTTMNNRFDRVDGSLKEIRGILDSNFAILISGQKATLENLSEVNKKLNDLKEQMVRSEINIAIIVSQIRDAEYEEKKFDCSDLLNRAGNSSAATRKLSDNYDDCLRDFQKRTELSTNIDIYSLQPDMQFSHAEMVRILKKTRNNWPYLGSFISAKIYSSLDTKKYLDSALNYDTWIQGANDFVCFVEESRKHGLYPPADRLKALISNGKRFNATRNSFLLNKGIPDRSLLSALNRFYGDFIDSLSKIELAKFDSLKKDFANGVDLWRDIDTLASDAFPASLETCSGGRKISRLSMKFDIPNNFIEYTRLGFVETKFCYDAAWDWREMKLLKSGQMGASYNLPFILTVKMLSKSKVPSFIRELPIYRISFGKTVTNRFQGLPESDPYYYAEKNWDRDDAIGLKPVDVTSAEAASTSIRSLDSAIFYEKILPRRKEFLQKLEASIKEGGGKELRLLSQGKLVLNFVSKMCFPIPYIHNDSLHELFFGSNPLLDEGTTPRFYSYAIGAVEQSKLKSQPEAFPSVSEYGKAKAALFSDITKKILADPAFAKKNIDPVLEAALDKLETYRTVAKVEKK